MPLDLRETAWPVERLAVGMLALAREARLPIEASEAGKSAEILGVSEESLDLAQADARVQAISRAYALEAEPEDLPHGERESFLSSGGPAVVLVPGEARFWLLLRGSRKHVWLVGSDMKIVRAETSSFLSEWCRDDQAASPELFELLDRLDLKGLGASRARDRLMSHKAPSGPVSGVWSLRLAPHRSLPTWVRRFRIATDVSVFIGAHAATYTLVLVSWWLLGKGALSGRIDSGWIWAWGLVLLSSVAARMMSLWAESRLSIRLGALLRDRLLTGILSLRPDETRHHGIGHHLGRVLEASALESLALNGGSAALLGALELMAAFAMMGMWGGGALQMSLLWIWSLAGLWLARSYFVERRRWTGERLGLSHHLIEVMVAQRTRIAQQSPARWHVGEDASLSRYLSFSRSMDGSAAWLFTWPRGWVVLGCLPIVVGFVSGEWPLARVAVSFGLVILAERALDKLVQGSSALADAQIAWSSVRPLLLAADRPSVTEDASVSIERAMARDRHSTSKRGSTLLEVSDLTYVYPERFTPTLHRVNARLERGEKILLEAPSGGGKSTLVSLLTGVRQPASGLVLLDGYDRNTLGELGWTRHVAAAPQFGENHVITETFAFNLLMGRGWPPGPDDLQEARELCERLGLGELLEKMPGGMNQVVGECGWQLSHGERSRLFMARALLQGGELVILDESFAALDPETRMAALRAASENAETLLVVAHP